ncbi:hypothetical protein GIB67_028555 [Kingdonia uniflora]|uniref:PUB 12/19-like N-terminal domain-containing protein n=1 Tax=Kingdonia uniflora TaxID=39325 RepID=A0A7J7KW96_9MAGN|nr:hypothetical protein GIB67_028555 [Kingdonia uniflora]
MGRFYIVYDQLNQVLDGMPYDELEIPDEVKEQVELMCMQLRRAKRRTDTQDIEFAMDMMVVFSKIDYHNTNSAILEIGLSMGRVGSSRVRVNKEPTRTRPVY